MNKAIKRNNIINDQALQNITKSLKQVFAIIVLVVNLVILPMTLMMLMMSIRYFVEYHWGDPDFFHFHRSFNYTRFAPFLSFFLFHAPFILAFLTGTWINSKSFRRHGYFESFMLTIPYWFGTRKDRALVLRYKSSRLYPLFKFLTQRLIKRCRHT